MIIYIKNLRLKTIIGIHKYEREKRQKIYLDIKIDFNLEENFSDNIDDTIDYDKLIEKIDNFVSKTDFFTLEKLAQRISDLIFEDKRVISTNIKLTKGKIFKNIDSVIIEYNRSW